MGDKDKIKKNPFRLTTQKARLDALCTLALFPVVVCFAAFTRPVIYRITGGLHGGTFKDVLHKGNENVDVGQPCKRQGWLNNAMFVVTCDNTSLDIHSVLAVTWLFLFTMQIFFIKYNFRGFHKAVGKYGMPIAFVNALGMMQFAAYDFFYPMEYTTRPAAFTPFMWFLSVEMILYLKSSYDALQNHDITMHSLWMYRAFCKSFSTPVMRFYPMVLRYFFGTQCAALNGEKAVFAAMTVAAFFISGLSYIANLLVLEQPMDKFMKTTFIKSGVTLLIDLIFASSKGMFITGMYTCWKVGPENFNPSMAFGGGAEL